MPTILVITGGIACGKSHCLDELMELFPERSAKFFSCDEAVSNLLTENEIIGRLIGFMGDSILESDGTIDRLLLREGIFNSSEIRRKVEGVLHPAVLKMAEIFVEDSRESRLILLEVPLLYEVNFPIHRDFDLVIGCSQKTQIRRLTAKRGISLDQAGKILASQLPIQTKIDQAHFVAWNDGSVEAFDGQIETISETILSNTKAV